jgi:hypothetical protein
MSSKLNLNEELTKMNIEDDFKLPELDWDHLENSLKQANQEINQVI